MEQNGSDATYKLTFVSNADKVIDDILKLVEASTKDIERSFAALTKSIDDQTIAMLDTIKTRIADSTEAFTLPITVTSDNVDELITSIQTSVGKDWKLTVPVDITPTIVMQSFLENQKDEAAQNLMKDLPHLEIPIYPTLDWSGIQEQISGLTVPIIADLSNLPASIDAITVDAKATITEVTNETGPITIPAIVDVSSIPDITIGASLNLDDLQKQVTAVQIPVVADMKKFAKSITGMEPIEIPVSLAFEKGKDDTAAEADATIQKTWDLSSAFTKITENARSMGESVTASIGDIRTSLDELYADFKPILDRLFVGDSDKPVPEATQEIIDDLKKQVADLTASLKDATDKAKDGFDDSTDAVDKFKDGIDSSALAAMLAAEQFAVLGQRALAYFDTGMQKLIQSAGSAIHLLTMVGNATDEVMAKSMRATKGLLEDNDVSEMAAQLSGMYVAAEKIPGVLKTVTDHAHAMHLDIRDSFKEVTNLMTTSLNPEVFRQKFGQNGAAAMKMFREEMIKATKEMGVSSSSMLNPEQRMAARAQATDAVLRQFGQASEGADTLNESLTRFNENLSLIQQQLSGPFHDALTVILVPVNAFLEILNRLPGPLMYIIGSIATLGAGLTAGVGALIMYYKAAEMLGLNFKSVIGFLSQFRASIILTSIAQKVETISTLAQNAATWAMITTTETATGAKLGLMGSIRLLTVSLVTGTVAYLAQNAAVLAGIPIDEASALANLGLAASFDLLTASIIPATMALYAMIAPFLPIIAAIGAVVAALYLLWDVLDKGWDDSLLGQFFKWLSQYIPTVTPVIIGFGKLFEYLKEAVGGAMVYLGGLWNDFVSGFMEVINAITPFINELIKMVLGLFNIQIEDASIIGIFEAVIAAIKDCVKYLDESGFLSWLKDVVKWIGKIAAVILLFNLSPLIVSILAVTAVLWALIQALKWLYDTFKPLIDIIGAMGVHMSALSVITTGVAGPIGLLTGLVLSMKDHMGALPDVITPVSSALNSLMGIIKTLTSFSNPLTGTISLLTTLMSVVGKTSLKDIFNPGNVSQMIGSLTQFIGIVTAASNPLLMIQRIMETLGITVTDLATVGKSAFDTIMSGINSQIGSSLAYIKDVITFILSILDKLMHPFRTLQEIIMYLADRFAAFRVVAELVKGIFDKISDSVQAIVGALQWLTGIMKKLIDMINNFPPPPDWISNLAGGDFIGAGAKAAADAASSITKHDVTTTREKVSEVVTETKRESKQDTNQALSQMNDHLKNLNERPSTSNSVDMKGMNITIPITSGDIVEAINNGTVDAQKLGEALGRVISDNVIGKISHELSTWGI